MLKHCVRISGLPFLSALFVATTAFAHGGPSPLDLSAGSPPSDAARIETRASQPGIVVVKLLRPDNLGAGPGKTGSAVVDDVLARHTAHSVTPVLPRRLLAHKVGGTDLSRVFIIEYQDGAAPETVAAELARLDAVEYAEPLFAYPLAGQPNDTQISQQLGYLNHMQFLSGWDVAQGEQGNAVIAIIDGGTDWRHADLVDNIWANPNETINGIDDDDNGLIDDVRGWNFANNTNDPTGLASTPQSASHGTHTAGIACAVTNNSVQVAGASWNAKVMPINTALASADRVIAWGYQGIVYAALNGADAISLSWGGSGSPSTFESEVIQFAWEQGAAICAAAGNDGGDADMHFPSAYPHVLSVTNVDLGDHRVSVANFGFSVDVAAHGNSILSTTPNNTTGFNSGTSMSTPFVAAACALVKTRWPDYTADQVMQRVRVSCDNIDAANPEFPGQLGFGRLNVSQALTKNTPAIRISDIQLLDQDGDGVLERGENVALNITVTNFLARAQTLSFSLSETSTYVTVSNPMQAVASIDSLETLQLPTFNLLIGSNAVNNHTVSVELRYNSSTPVYADIDRFKFIIQPLFLNHTVNQVNTTITSMGRLGYALARGDGTDGIGFSFGSGPNVLFEAAMMMGTSPTKLVDAARGLVSGGNLTYNSNFGTPAGGTPTLLPPVLADQQSRAIFSDGAAAPSLRLNLNMRQDAYLFSNAPDNDYIILRYRIRNDASGAITGLRVGWYQDWDIGDAGDAQGAIADRTGYDATRGLGYTWDENGAANGVHLGTAVLTQPGTTAFRGIWNDEVNPNNLWFGVYDGYTKDEKWQTLSGGIISPEAGPEDVSIAIATGPFNLAIGDSITVAFVFAAGNDLADLQGNTDAAIAKWETLGPLTPVTLTDLSATQDGAGVVVRWRTSDERDIAAYRVYRGLDGDILQALGPDVEPNAAQRYEFRDATPPPGRNVYRVAEVSSAGDVVFHGSVEVTVAGLSPARSFLSSGTPNPFNPSTTVHYGLTVAGPVRLVVYDARGRHVRFLVQSAYTAAGAYSAAWNGLDDRGHAVPSGSYHVRLQLADQVFTRRVTLLK